MKEYNDTLLYSFFRPIVKFLIKFIYRPTYINTNLIPSDGRIIIAGNHTSILDAFLLMSSTKRHIHFLAKKEIFGGLTGIIIRHMGLISVDRSARDKKNVLVNATKYLNNDKVVGIFPEGTTEKDNYPNLLPFKTGAVRLSNDTNTEIIPFKIIGRYKVFRRSVKIIFGKPIKCSGDLEKTNKMLYNIVNDMKE